MKTQIAIRLETDELTELDRLIAAGTYRNRAAAIRKALRELLAQERSQWIAEQYRRAYSEQPQDLTLLEGAAQAADEVILDSVKNIPRSKKSAKNI